MNFTNQVVYRQRIRSRTNGRVRNYNLVKCDRKQNKKLKLLENKCCHFISWLTSNTAIYELKRVFNIYTQYDKMALYFQYLINNLNNCTKEYSHEKFLQELSKLF